MKMPPDTEWHTVGLVGVDGTDTFCCARGHAKDQAAARCAVRTMRRFTAIVLAPGRLIPLRGGWEVVQRRRIAGLENAGDAWQLNDGRLYKVES
jgi:hypothetical protein